MSAFGQTDLDQRVHRNQATRSLGRMAFGILQTFLSRVQSLGVVPELPELSTVLRQFQVKDEEFETVEYQITEEERPPMDTIEDYRKKRGLKPSEERPSPSGATS
jgi:glucosyl-3-phosphoglycerate synthase